MKLSYPCLAVVCGLGFSALTALRAEDGPRPNVMNRLIKTVPPSIPKGGATMTYTAFMLNGTYCVRPQIVVAQRTAGAPWPRWSKAFTLNLVEASGNLVRPDTTVNVPQSIPEPSLVSAAQIGPVMLPPLATWCSSPAKQPPVWFFSVDDKKQPVIFPRVAASERR